jgi:hypothetical protein
LLATSDGGNPHKGIDKWTDKRINQREREQREGEKEIRKRMFDILFDT